MASEFGRLSPPAGGYRRIAVLRLSSIGDVVLTLPVVQALHGAFPDAELHYWVKEEYQDLVRHDPSVHHVRVLEKDARRIEDLVSMGAEFEDCDLIVDLHGSLRTRLLTFRQKAPVLSAPTYRWMRERWVRAKWSRPTPTPPALERYAASLKPLGLHAPSLPKLHAGDAAERWAEAWFGEAAFERAPLALAPGAQHATKRWPEDFWVTLTEQAAAAGAPLLVFSTAAERQGLPKLARRIEGMPDARWVLEPLARAAALLGRCAAAVTHDSGLMHMAAARGLRVVALFGSTSPVLGFAPAGAGHIVLGHDLSCRPCTVHGRESCPLGHFRCMRELSVETVWQAAQGLLGI
ncbi:MAG: glycosyltransferase family 9 protein [Candidatus Eisenbacteria bacterium]